MAKANHKLLERTYRFAESALDAAGDDVSAMAEPAQTVLLLYNAQGIIDNGGLQYFFEADFPECPPYSLFVDAYRRIGAAGMANCLEEALKAFFPFDEPHLKAAERNARLDELRESDDPVYRRLDRDVFNQEEVWVLLTTYVKANKKALK